ncbi:39074_t:CDS:2 [Gigaspora margarita]|uniref:39074_t:CDS:1 n=1 Tax=Gigaspora margarita TaxID=4874 RepID=A0ABN7VI08_GIGMA|nr:39074_t:CDS:2 [Gigaspora margarita]
MNVPSNCQTVKTNRAAIDIIKKHETFRYNFYDDGAKYRTIGYGHNCDVHDCSKIQPPIILAYGEKLLKEDLVEAERCVIKNTKFKLNSNQFSALVSFIFNLGCTKYKSSTLLSKLNAGKTKGASTEFGQYIHANNKVSKDLKVCREKERKLFCKSGGC